MREPSWAQRLRRSAAGNCRLRRGSGSARNSQIPRPGPPATPAARSEDSLAVSRAAPGEAAPRAPPRPPASAGGPTRPPLGSAASATFHLKITPTCAGKQARAATEAARSGPACAARAPALLPHVSAGAAQSPPPRLVASRPRAPSPAAPGPSAPYPTRRAQSSALQLSVPDASSSPVAAGSQAPFLPSAVFSRPPLSPPTASARRIGF